jgi:hypothetical protein
MPILLAGTTEFVHTEQVSALFTFHLGQVLLYLKNVKENSPNLSTRSTMMSPKSDSEFGSTGLTHSDPTILNPYRSLETK